MKWQDGKVIITDSRGRPSVTLPMVYAAFLAVLFRWLVADHWGYANMDGVELAAALAAVGGIWMWREGQTRNKPPEE